MLRFLYSIRAENKGNTKPGIVQMLQNPLCAHIKLTLNVISSLFELSKSQNENH